MRALSFLAVAACLLSATSCYDPGHLGAFPYKCQEATVDGGTDWHCPVNYDCAFFTPKLIGRHYCPSKASCYCVHPCSVTADCPYWATDCHETDKICVRTCRANLDCAENDQTNGTPICTNNICSVK